MNKELCFILDNKNIYLDHILVDYESSPYIVRRNARYLNTFL